MYKEGKNDGNKTDDGLEHKPQRGCYLRSLSMITLGASHFFPNSQLQRCRKPMMAKMILRKKKTILIMNTKSATMIPV